MKSRLPQGPALKSAPDWVSADVYNRIRAALRQLGSPLQLMLPGRRGFALSMERDLWLCVDRNLDDLPILAWTEFRCSRRTALSDPVPCRMVYYHAYANVLVHSLLDDADRIVAQRMRRARRGHKGARIVPFVRARRRHA